MTTHGARWLAPCLGALLGALALLGACASRKAPDAPGASPEGRADPAATSASPPTSDLEPTTVDEAGRQLDLAERDLLAMIDPPEPTSPGGPERTPSPKHPEAPHSEKLGGGRCVDVCRALESMRRARDHVCKLAGDAEPARCTSASERVERARARAVATCPACA